MKKNLNLLIILVSMLPLTANSISTAYHVVGTSCGKYLSDISISEEYKKVYSWWIAGYITAINFEKDRVTLTDKYANDNWVRQYCEKNPLDSFINSVISLSYELDKYKIKK